MNFIEQICCFRKQTSAEAVLFTVQQEVQQAVVSSIIPNTRCCRWNKPINYFNDVLIERQQTSVLRIVGVSFRLN